MATTLKISSTAQTDVMNQPAGTQDYAEKFQTMELEWKYIPFYNWLDKEIDISLSGDLSTGYSNVRPWTITPESSVLVWRSKFRCETQKVPYSTTPALSNFTPMTCYFSAFGDLADATSDIDYGDSGAPSGIGLRGYLATSDAGSGLGFVAREVWDDIKHGQFDVLETPWMYNCIFLKNTMVPLLHGGNFPFNRVPETGEQDPFGTYFEQNIERLWPDGWHRNGVDADTTNDWIPSPPEHTEILRSIFWPSYTNPDTQFYTYNTSWDGLGQGAGNGPNSDTFNAAYMPFNMGNGFLTNRSRTHVQFVDENILLHKQSPSFQLSPPLYGALDKTVTNGSWQLMNNIGTANDFFQRAAREASQGINVYHGFAPSVEVTPVATDQSKLRIRGLDMKTLREIINVPIGAVGGVDATMATQYLLATGDTFWQIGDGVTGIHYDPSQAGPLDWYKFWYNAVPVFV